MPASRRRWQMNIDSNESRQPVELVIRDQRITAQLTVYDASYRPIASAVGELRTQLAPGVYEAESTFGQNRQRQFVVLNPGSPQTIHFHSPETGMSSAAPLPGTTTHQGHQAV